VTTELVLLSRVWCRGHEITRPRLRSLLALLAEDLRTGAGTARLVDALWPDEQPENPAKALQVLVSHARSQLGSDIIAATPVGYRLSLAEDEVDASAVVLRAAASARSARGGDHAAALEHAEAGLALWDGPASAEAGDDPLSTLRAARASTYRSLVRARALALSRLGRRAEALEPLTELAREYPRDEEILAELLRSEAATAGPAAALARYDGYRRTLRDELGSDPGPALRDVHRELLADDLPAVRRGVPHEPNTLLGRDDDIAAVAQLLRTARVTSIVGPGGLGKTRLAHTLSRRAEQRVVHFVELAGVAADDGVVGQVASALEVGESGLAQVGRVGVPADALAGIVQTLGSGAALLVLDNCEHVVEGAAELASALVAMCPDLRILTTSRAPLGLSSESVYLLGELSLATAVELFTQRAKAARSDVDLPAAAVAELCGHLDGLPLAVELAAARVRVMSVAQIARGLDDRFTLLRGGARDAPARHRTLEAVIDWSWHLLDSGGQAAMRALSVFPGGFTADAACHVLDDATDVGDVLTVVEQLVDQSLLKVTDTGAGARFRMLETVREFSAARRTETETGRVTGRFLAWARDFGAAHHESIFGEELVAAVARIRAEQENLVQALRLGLDAGDGASVAAISAALGGLWSVEANFARLPALTDEPARMLSHYRPPPGFVEATRTAALLAAMGSFLLGVPGAARSLLTLRLLPQAPPDTVPRATATVLLAISGPDPGALQALCDSDEPLVSGMANEIASYALENANDLAAALSAAQRMVTVFADRGIPAVQAMAESRLGELYLRMGRGAEARHHLGAALSIVAGVGAWSSVVRLRWSMVLADLQRGAVDEAEHGLELARRDGGDEAIGIPMIDLTVRAEIALARGEVDAGLEMWRRAAGRMDDLEHAPDGADQLGVAAWARQIDAVTVVAHAQHGRLDLVGPIAAELPRMLGDTLTASLENSPQTFTDLPVCGVLLVAVAMVAIDGGDPQAIRSGVRMLALAERFYFERGFQPTMSPARVRQVAADADGPEYDDALSSYAGLEPGALRAAALAELRHRDRVSGPGPA
jgi:predicted ATPase/DNA-binding SARP family transcriptional activator